MATKGGMPIAHTAYGHIMMTSVISMYGIKGTRTYRDPVVQRHRPDHYAQIQYGQVYACMGPTDFKLSVCRSSKGSPFCL